MIKTYQIVFVTEVCITFYDILINIIFCDIL